MELLPTGQGTPESPDASDGGAAPPATPRRGFLRWLVTTVPGFSLLLLVLLVASTLIYHRVVVRPWTLEPPIPSEELAVAWDRLMAEATPDPTVAGDDDQLIRTLRALRENDDELLREAVERVSRPGERSRQDQDRLFQVNRIVGEFMRWAEGGGGITVDDPCRLEERYPVADLFLLGRVVLAEGDVGVPSPTPEARLRAVFKLSRTLRGAGGPLPVIAGRRLVGHAASAAERWGKTGEMLRLRHLGPRNGEVYRAMVVEALCVDRLLGRHFSKMTDRWGSRQMAETGAPIGWLEPRSDYLQRERRMVRAWYLERLLAARAQQDDLAAMARTLALPDERSALPASVALRLVAVDLAEPIEDAAGEIERYEEAMARWLMQERTQ